jgi:type I restriction-modification system DNA methylase subunit
MPRAASSNLFDESIQILQETKAGQEAAMYPAIRDLFCGSLGYERRKVLTDIAGDAGRPDVTVRAASGLLDGAGRVIDIDWIVVEAKDEHDAFTTVEKREAIFAKKAKYITPDTAWFVMVSPTIIVARPTQTAELNALNDIIFGLNDRPSETEFKAKFVELSKERAGVPERLNRFRAGDITQIASEKLFAPEDVSRRLKNQVRLARKNFFYALHTTTNALQEATIRTLRSLGPQIKEIENLAADFGAKYNGYRFDPYTLTITGAPKSYEETRSHNGDVARLTRRLKRAGAVARLALSGLREFRLRVGIGSDAESEKRLLEMFAIETANLVLARILLIRFFEDHGFFGETRYICNGGVEAFQQMRTSFELSYTRLLKEAYNKAQSLYAAAFDETELDWVFSADDNSLSAAIEWAMYQLSRYDFSTVRGDILSGIYDRFLEPKQRKQFGEYYTPPSIARYIVDRLELRPEDTFLDPACGSGTFLIERYQQLVGEDADRGIATYSQVLAAFQHIAGADLNTFSAILAQIQLLWHVLIFRDDLLRGADFPDILIAEKANSLMRGALDANAHNRFVEIDHDGYGGVAGNPPYVRPERAADLDEATKHYFEEPRSQHGGGGWPGISPEANLYAFVCI